MFGAVAAFWTCLTALLPVLIGVSALTLVAFVLDAKRGTW